MPIDVSSLRVPQSPIHCQRANGLTFSNGLCSACRVPIAQITLETLVSFVVILLGVAFTAAPLKNVTWASEMRTKYVPLPRIPLLDVGTLADQPAQPFTTTDPSTKSTRAPALQRSHIEAKSSLLANRPSTHSKHNHSVTFSVQHMQSQMYPQGAQQSVQSQECIT